MNEPIEKEEKLGGIIRIEFQKDFGIICRHAMEDERLSLKAKGIIAYLSSRPRGWVVRTTDIVNRSKDGLGAVYSGMRELKEAGYAKYETIRENGKIIAQEWRVIVYKTSPELKNPLVESPLVKNGRLSKNGIKKERKDTATAALRPVAGATVLKGRVGRIVEEYHHWATRKNYFVGKRKANLEQWRAALVQLKESHSDSLDWIEEVLNWYYTTKDPYHKLCHHLTTFCQNFESIERAYCRDTGTPLPSDEEDSPKVTKNILPPRVMTYEDVQAEAD